MIDCSRRSPDYGSSACEDQSNVAIGVIVTIGLVVLAVGFIWWRRALAKHRDPDSEYPPGVVGDWRDRRDRRRARQEAYRRQLQDEYMDGIENRDPTALEAEDEFIRWPMRIKAGMTAYILMLLVVVPVLVVVFAVIKHLAHR